MPGTGAGPFRSFMTSLLLRQERSLCATTIIIHSSGTNSTTGSWKCLDFILRLSVVGKHAENEKKGIPNDFSMADINGSAAAIFIAGSGTTYTTTLVAILNLLLNPEVFQKARA